MLLNDLEPEVAEIHTLLTEAEELISLPYSNTGKKVQALKKYKSKKSPPEPHVI